MTPSPWLAIAFGPVVGKGGVERWMIDWKAIHGDAFAGRRVLVTGAAGFIGSHLCEALVTLGAEAVALDDLSAGDWANLDAVGDHPSLQRVTGSILDAAVVKEVVAGCDCVFHQAALGSVPGSMVEPRRYYAVNVEGTLEVLDAARKAGVRRFIFAASSSAYGDPPPPDDEAAKRESLPPRPRSPYAASKLAAEHSVRAWFHSFGLDGVCLRYFNIFGPRQSPHSAYAAVIAAFAAALQRGERPIIFGDGEQARDFTYVANAVHANLLAARHVEPLQGEVLNVAAGGRVSLNHLCEVMAELFARPDLRAEHQPGRAGDIRHSQAALDRIHALLGYAPMVDFTAGLEETVRWYRQNLV